MLILAPAFWTGCGNPVKLDPVQLEQQYVELTPYWEMIFTNKTAIVDETAAIGFSKHYQEARDLLIAYHDASRDKDPVDDNGILWNLHRALDSASARTNKMVTGK